MKKRILKRLICRKMASWCYWNENKRNKNLTPLIAGNPRWVGLITQLKKIFTDAGQDIYDFYKGIQAYWLAKPHCMNSNVPINIKGARPYFRAMVTVSSAIWLLTAPFTLLRKKGRKETIDTVSDSSKTELIAAGTRYDDAN